VLGPRQAVTPDIAPRRHVLLLPPVVEVWACRHWGSLQWWKSGRVVAEAASSGGSLGMSSLRQRGKARSGACSDDEEGANGEVGAPLRCTHDEPSGPLSLYFPDHLVRSLMAREPALCVSFIEAEQALLYTDGEPAAAMSRVLRQRKLRKERQRTSAGGLTSAADGRGGGRGIRGSWGGQTPGGGGSWVTSFVSTAIIVLVAMSIFVVGLVDGVFAVPDFLRVRAVAVFAAVSVAHSSWARWTGCNDGTGGSSTWK
jgi:hypothetical protein